MVTRQILKINEVEVNSNTTTIIMDLEYEFVHKDKVRFTPNTTEGLGMRHFTKYHKIIMDFDSHTDIFDAYIDDDGKNPAIPTFSIEFNSVNAGTPEVETWTFEASKSFVFSRGELRVERYVEKKPERIIVICIGTRSQTFV